MLLQIFQQLVAAPLTNEVCTFMRLVLKSLWSTTYMGIPAVLTNPDHINAWTSALLVALAQNMPEVCGQADASGCVDE